MSEKRKPADGDVWKSRYEAAIRASGQVFYYWDAAANRLEFGGQVQEIAGYSVAELSGGLGAVLGRVHADDVGRVIAAADLILAGERSHLTYRFRRKDGREILVEDDAAPVRDASGAVIGAVGFLADVTEREAARRAVAESERKFRGIFETDIVAIAINADPEGAYLEVNDEWVRLTGFTRVEAIGRTSIELGLWPDPDAFRRIAGEMLGAATVQNREIELRRKDGTIRWTVISGARVELAARACVLSFTRDVTDRKRAERALADSEERYRGLVERLPDALVVHRDGIVVYANPAAVRLFGASGPAELVGRDGLGFVEADDRAAAWQRILRVQNERIPSDVHEETLVGLDGRAIRVEALSAPMVYDGAPAVQTVLRDVTARDRSDTERRDLEEQLRQSQKLEAIGRLAGGVAHDFNNLLTVIRGSTSLAVHALAPDSPARDDLREVEQAAVRAAELTRQLLTFARRQMVSPGAVDLNEVLNGISGMLRRMIGEDVALVATPAADLWKVRIDRGQLEQVLVNLAVNARDAMPKGGSLFLAAVNVRVRNRDARRVPALPTGDYVKLLVRDTGCGMTDEVRRHVFEPFFTTKRAGEGSGLGLATCYGIIRQNGGAITVESELGRGTSFTIHLPRAEEAAVADAPQPDAHEAAGGSESVLLVEDEPLVRKLAARTLRARGYAVTEAGSGEEALALVKSARPGGYQLLLTDVVMPGIRGTEVARRVRTLDPSIKVLFISGYAEDLVSGGAAAAAPQALLPKPFTPRVLADRVRAVLDAPAV